MAKKKKLDACAKKVKARYKVWPSAYASGAVAKCRKVGAANWGNSTKKAATGGIISAIDKPKRPARNYRGGGVIAAGCGQVEEPRRKVTRTY
jgi:hypothetical protein|tara:strand:- start:272 stop:547 length:276 start_codon:yes stop_codon:yes gene_type:complete